MKSCGVTWGYETARDRCSAISPLSVTEEHFGCVAQWLERWSLTGELSLSHARPAADG